MRLDELSFEALGCIRLWAFLICISTVYVIIQMFVQKQKKSKAICTSVLALAEYVFFHLQLEYVKFGGEGSGNYPAPFSGVNIFVLIGIQFVFSVLSAYLLYYCRNWENNHLTDIAVKESLDNLPAGICYCNKAGKVVLINNSMHEFLKEIRLSGGNDPIKNYDEFKSTDGTDPVFRLRNGTVFILRKNIIETARESFTEYLALDITPKYVLTEKLAEENARLREKGEELRQQSRTIDEVIINREILDTKIKIHNNFGQLLLSSKYILSHNTDIDTKNELINRWKQVTVLRADNNENKVTSSIADINRAAKAIGVNIIYRDALPGNLSRQHTDILEHMLHEALTNSFSHAHADSLYVVFEDKKECYEVTITNNGKKPEKSITEGGGLSSLRKLIENHGGRMKIEAFPEFILKAELKK